VINFYFNLRVKFQLLNEKTERLSSCSTAV
jgi:hypothetical protein